ncbi:hypothetical protein PIB30_074384, partial [Stylosanthes scabra]|nr:hypothetical protein [Stylosanthes scabra]
MTCLLAHFREKKVRKAWRKLRKDMGSKDRRKEAKKRRELTPRARALQLPRPRPKGGWKRKSTATAQPRGPERAATPT